MNKMLDPGEIGALVGLVNQDRLIEAEHKARVSLTSHPNSGMLAGGNVVLMVNNSGTIQVFQSTDDGLTFTRTQSLVHHLSPPGTALNYTDARVESPTRALNPIPTWEQYVQGPLQRLLYFNVPVVAAD